MSRTFGPCGEIIVDGTGGFSSKDQYIVSDSWVVPAGIYNIFVLATGGGGGAASGRSNATNSNGGGGAQTALTVGSFLMVTPGDTLNITVGAGGVGGTGVAAGTHVAGTDGGDSYVDAGGMPLVYSAGGLASSSQNDAGANENGGSVSSNSGVLFALGTPGDGGIDQAGGGDAQAPRYSTVTTAVYQPSGPVVSGGTGTAQGAGGGASPSGYYGLGSDGGDAETNGTDGATYGIGGSGGGGTKNTGSAPGAGGDGGNGVVEIYY